ncbi:MAG: 4Fe-4S binding protein [Syntrophomonadaceae bacterium]|jgi:NADH-quinone oxidoreductase subunit I|nr:NADH-quinone oxidoreductase subunit I [Bacillota bacterium]NLP24396.1 NADH-quinone oxidoreductase subunit I [Syntrophomonadaceae bacterium]
MYGTGVLKGMAITLKHFFSRKRTIQYPEQMPELYERYRGHLYLEFEKCIVCGICSKTCPNGVLSLEDARDENTKKKKLLSYTIDHQYCMFCNLCVEGCPAHCLHFDHDFERSQYNRDDIKEVYHRPPEMDQVAPGTSTPGTGDANEPDPGLTEEALKKQKKMDALMTALDKNPVKLLSRYVEGEEDAQILADILQADRGKAEKLVELMADDQDKARKVAVAFVNKEKKQRQSQTEGGEKHEHE